MSEWVTQQPIENANLKRDHDLIVQKYQNLLRHHANLISAMYSYDHSTIRSLYQASLTDKRFSFRDDLDNMLILQTPTCLEK